MNLEVQDWIASTFDPVGSALDVYLENKGMKEKKKKNRDHEQIFSSKYSYWKELNVAKELEH